MVSVRAYGRLRGAYRLARSFVNHLVDSGKIKGPAECLIFLGMKNVFDSKPYWGGAQGAKLVDRGGRAPESSSCLVRVCKG